MEDIYQQIVDIAKTYGSQKVILFGSRARGTNLPKSDIDIAVEGCSDFWELENDIQKNTQTLLMIDVVNLDGIVSEDIRSRIASEGKVLYEEVR